MSKKSLAKTEAEWLLEFINDRRRATSSAVRLEDVAQYVLDNNLYPVRPESPHRVLTRKLKRVARKQRFIDARNRRVRTFIPTKIEAIDENGNRYIEVVWDHLHEMDLHHALAAFDQRDQNITKQRRAATRDVESFLEFNPNAQGHEEQFRFAFMSEEPQPQVEQSLEESPIRSTAKPRKRQKPR
jgi:hypothetical protein